MDSGERLLGSPSERLDSGAGTAMTRWERNRNTRVGAPARQEGSTMDFSTGSNVTSDDVATTVADGGSKSIA